MKVLKILPLKKPITAKLTIPGSKSYTNRSLFLAALTKDSVKIMQPLISDDTKALMGCLKGLGVKISENDKYIEVEGDISFIKNRSYKLDANLSGTTIRFMLALSTVIPGVKTLFGKDGLNKRPIKDLVEGLCQLGAKIKYLKKKGYPPVRILSSKLKSGTVKIKGSASSQFISALLMIAPLVGKVNIEVTEPQVSVPYIDMTIDIMEKFGVKVKNDNYKKYSVPSGQKYNTKQYVVEGDLSSAGYFLAIAALTKSTITLENINPNSKQADMRFVKILEDMGNKVVYGKNQITITGKGMKPVSVNMQDCPDQIQTLAVLAAFGKGTTKISGVQSLRIKETNRVFALTEELKKMGIKISATKDTLTVHGGNPKAARIKTYGDHRMAMSFAVAGAKIPGMEIVDPDVVNKTFPQFWKALDLIGIKNMSLRGSLRPKQSSPAMEDSSLIPIESGLITRNDRKNIVLIGMRGSGKTTIAKLLSKKLHKQYIELDELVAKKVGLTIPKIVEKYGWDFFRDKESEVVKGISLTNGKIISTGGGVITRPQNIDALKKNGLLIFLNASLETLVKRMGKNLQLPALTTKKTLKEEIQEVLKQRAELYKSTADEIIDTDNLNPEEAVNIILSKLEGVNVCMSIGDPIKQSLSPLIHNTGYNRLGISHQFVFIAKRVTKKDLESFLEKARSSGIRGISVTIPHKLQIIKYLDAIDPVAKEIGAVNTIVNDMGKLTGFNTDWVGAITALEKKVALKSKKIAVIGAGGAARAIVYGLTKKGAELTIFNRSLAKAKNLAKEFGCKYNSLDALDALLNIDIIINATSVGMNTDESLIDKKFINENHVVFDVVHTPENTRLIRDAKVKGAQVIFGYEMVLYQGIEQFKLYTGFDAPVETMKEVLIKNLK